MSGFSRVAGRRVTVLASLLIGLAGLLPARAERPAIVDRVSVTPVDTAGAAKLQTVRRGLEARIAALAETRLISVRRRIEDASRFDATIYDYTVEKGFELVLDAEGRELARRPLSVQPSLSTEELAEAQALVKRASPWAEGIARGVYRVSSPMPPVSVDPAGRRLVNVSVLAIAPESRVLLQNEIVSVHVPSGTITRHATGAPETSSAAVLTCNPPPSAGCGGSAACGAAYQVQWPLPDPVWKFKVRHPSCTQDVQSQGTGLELTDVYFRGRMVLKRAEMPVLNVLYDNNTCGPYRDWLDSEDCFQAVGTDVAPGIRVTSTTPAPYTFCEADPPTDSGNFTGVAIHDQGDALWLITETNAGWYRYVMEWRLHLDGTIEPIFGFGAVSNGCTCNVHHHHGYWRFEWALDASSDGTTDNPGTGINTLERRRPGTQDTWDPVASEGKFVRPAAGPEHDWFRIKNPLTQTAYILEPGKLDGSADPDGDGTPDAYARADLWALARTPGEIDDPNGGDTAITIDPWLTGESLGAAKRLVTWYRGGYRHDAGVDPEPCELVGPKLVFREGCQGILSLDQTSYGCGGTINLTVEDGDLRGSGTTSVAVSSTTEAAPETVTLTESPTGSGHFAGSLPISAGPPVAADGRISVANGDALAARYVDASACGTTNAAVDRTASVDCLPPGITNVRALNVTGYSATIAWDTTEGSSSAVHYGTTPPGTSSASASALVASHALAVSGLSECTTYYYWVASTDASGNTTASNAGGGYYAFRTTKNTLATYAYPGPPVAITDFSTVEVPISVPSGNIVQDVDAGMDLVHTYDNDLILSLITPTSSAITLSYRNGGSADDFTNTLFDDEASTPIASGSAPFTGSYRPDSPLSVVDGTNPGGTWKLRVQDMAAVDTGYVNSWFLTVTYPPGTCPAAPVPPPVEDGASGNAMTAARLNASGSQVHLLWDAAGCPATNYHLLYGALDSVASYGIAGGVCAIGPTGNYVWANVPAGDLWFLVVSDDGGTIEGTWGTDSAGAHRGGSTASGLCGIAARNNSGACP